MFERFTDRARHSVVLAQEEARRLEHNYIGTEHILLGLVREGEGVAARALASLDISLKAIRERVEVIVGRGDVDLPGHIPFTPRAKKVLELALREALQLGDTYIGTEHILLGLVREGEGVAAQVLVELGADLERVRQVVMEQQLAGYSATAEPEPTGIAKVTAPASEPESAETLPVRDVPTCGTCGSSLSRTLAVRTFQVTEADQPIAVRTAYCTDCGTVIGVVP